MFRKFKLEEARTVASTATMRIVAERGVDLSTPTRGRILSLGVLNSRCLYAFLPDDGWGHWTMIGADLEPVMGAEAILRSDLNANNIVTVIAGGDVFAIRRYRNDHRSFDTVLYKNGKEVPMTEEAPVINDVNDVNDDDKEDEEYW